MPTYTAAAMPAIAEAIGIRLSAAPYRIHGAAVFESVIKNKTLDVDVRLVFWPTIGRIDAYVGDCQIIFKDVTEYVVLPEVEVIFKRPPRSGHLLITCAGRVCVAS